MAVTYEQVRDWVLALPGGCEVMVESWGHPTLRVGDKMIAGGGPDSPTMSVKASKEDQAELIASAPAFGARIDECAEALSAFVDWSLHDVLHGRPGAPGRRRPPS